MDNIYVVGEKFIEFTKHNNVMTLTNLKDFINEKLSSRKKITQNFIIGQGIRHDQYTQIVPSIKKKISDFFFRNEQIMLQREDKKIVHKHAIENVLITKPTQNTKDEQSYSAHLVLDERSPEMSDHVTGQHLQGMLLTEAARQMMTAVTERHILDVNDRFNFYFALNKISPNFACFAFPLEVNIQYQQNHLQYIKGRCVKSQCSVSFTQATTKICEVDIEMTAFDKKVLRQIEENQAKNLLS